MGGLAASHTPHPGYERRWRSEIGRELSLHLRIHDALVNLSDKNKDRFLSLVADYAGALEKDGDMDVASKTIGALLKKPLFSARLLAQFPHILFDALA
jgi:flavin-dependent dehydrogenase